MIEDLLFWLAIPATGALFWLLPRQHRYRFLALASVAMVAAHDVFSAICLASFAVCLFTSLPRIAVGDNRAGLLLAAWIVALAGFIVVFKAEPIFVALTGGATSVADVIVPLGSSYYTFKMIHVAVDAYRRRAFDTAADIFFTYLFLFTAFVAGPIQRIDLFDSGRTAHLTPDDVLTAATRISFGVIKAVFLAGQILELRTTVTQQENITVEMLTGAPVASIWIVLISAYLIAYLNLAGYTDIAIGASRLFGIKIQENFNWPVLACSLPDFWRRWHITLSRWCQDYVYITVLAWLRNAYLPLFFSFQVMGLWHVISWNRVSWGLWQASGVLVAMLWTRALRHHGQSGKLMWLRMGFGWALTQMFITLSFIFVLGENTADALAPLLIIGRALGISL